MYHEKKRKLFSFIAIGLPYLPITGTVVLPWYAKRCLNRISIAIMLKFMVYYVRIILEGDDYNG